MPTFPPDIKSSIPKLSPQELEFFKEAKKIDPKFVNLFDSRAIPFTDVYFKVNKSLDKTESAIKFKNDLMGMSTALSALQVEGEMFFNPKMPNNFISSMKIANMANDIDVKMGDTTNATNNTQKTFGEFAKYQQMVECVARASSDYTGNTTATLDTIFQPYNDSMSPGNIKDYWYSLLSQVDIVNAALASFVPMREQVEEFAGLSSLKAMFNNPIANALLGGDISKGIPAIASPAMLKLLRLPPKF